jgi:hypothetical protein
MLARFEHAHVFRVYSGGFNAKLSDVSEWHDVALNDSRLVMFSSPMDARFSHPDTFKLAIGADGLKFISVMLGAFEISTPTRLDI